MKEQYLREMEIDRTLARVHHRGMVALAVVFSLAALGSLPIAILDFLPQWAELTLAGSGLLIGSTSVHEVPVTKSWLRQAEKRVEDFKKQNKIGV